VGVATPRRNAAVYAGTTELGVWFAGDHALRDVARLGRAL
jgi:hypothetical protein